MHQVGKKVLPGIFVGYVSRARMVRRLAHCGLRRPRELASEIHVKRFKHWEVAQEAKLLFPCADRSLKLFDLPPCPRGEVPATGNPEQDEKEEEDTVFDEQNGKILLEHEWWLHISPLRSTSIKVVRLGMTQPSKIRRSQEENENRHR